jgi:translation elongation factor EF-G
VATPAILESSEITVLDSSGIFPLVELKISSKSQMDKANMASALATIVQNDPTIFVNLDAESCEAMIGGASEMHLDDIVK